MEETKKNNMQIDKIYFDMDDTLADFGLGLIEICGIQPVSQETQTEAQDEAMWAAVKEADHFYYHLKACDPGIELFEQLRSRYGDKVEILTAIPKAKRGIITAEEDKRRWVKEKLGEDIVVNVVHSSKDKKSFAVSSACFLIDDLKKNIAMWNEAGGAGIRFLKDDLEFTWGELENRGLLYNEKIWRSYALPVKKKSI